MSAATALARGQQLAESLMVDACVIRRITYVSDPVTGVQSAMGPEIYSGRCKIQSTAAAASSRRDEAGQASRLVLPMELHLPVSATGLAADDQVTVTASAHDADLVGRLFRIRDLMHKTMPTARRVGIEEITS